MKSKSNTSILILEKLDLIQTKLEYSKAVLEELVLEKRKQNLELSRWLEAFKAKKVNEVTDFQ